MASATATGLSTGTHVLAPGMPKRVDPRERRQVIAEAVCEVIGDRGWEAVSLRDVASAAGVSMGQVQHYFTTKADMLNQQAAPMTSAQNQ